MAAQRGGSNAGKTGARKLEKIFSRGEESRALAKVAGGNVARCCCCCGCCCCEKDSAAPWRWTNFGNTEFNCNLRLSFSWEACSRPPLPSPPPRVAKRPWKRAAEIYSPAQPRAAFISFQSGVRSFKSSLSQLGAGFANLCRGCGQGSLHWFHHIIVWVQKIQWVHSSIRTAFHSFEQSFNEFFHSNYGKL